MLYTNKTKLGYKIVKFGFYYNDKWELDARHYFVIAYRETFKDYLIALNYNFYEGTWGQGIYNFNSVENAIKWIKENKKYIEIYD